MIARFEWVDAKSVEEAIAALAREEGDIGHSPLAKAGGVDVLDRLKEGLDTPGRLVNLRTVPG
ncbi:MAG TPA: hypothetical protein VN783_16095, partial [Thermoanaerobaculia bacterium]|nr:hypothetical protein [Thermoanaerobaculia bacterium]